MRIGIDIRLQNETGVGRYIRNLIHWLPKIDKKNEYVFLDYPIRWHSLQEQIEMPGLLAKENLDLVHFPYFNAPLFYNGPFVVTIHDLIIDHFPTGRASTLPYPLYVLKRWGYKRVMQHAVDGAKVVIVPSNATKQELIDHYHVLDEKIVVTYEGVDHTYQNQRSKIKDQNDMSKIKKMLERKQYFLYVGNAYPHKNLETLIGAFTTIASQHKDVVLILVGKEDYFYKQLSKSIKTIPIHYRIIIIGEVTDKTLDWLYSHATASIVPSLMEGFGFPALEAMNKKCLVIASTIPALSEVCDNGVLFFDPNNVVSLEEQMNRVLKEPKETFARKISQAYNHVQKYKWIETARQTVSVYERCLGV